MKRRTFSGLVAGAALLPRQGNAKSEVRWLRLGILRPDSFFSNKSLILALQQLGYAEGQTLILNEQFAEQGPSSLPELARGVAELKPDVILTIGAAATHAVLRSTVIIPIVFLGSFDPVSAGFVASLARPSRSATGFLIASEGTFAARKLAFLKEAVPTAKRIAVLLPDDPDARRPLEEVQAAASELGVELVAVEGRGGTYEEAFARIAAAQAEALLVGAHPSFVRDRKPIIELCARYRLPAIYEWADQVRDGGLMAYGPNLDKLYARVALYIDRILKGEKPGDLPVEQATSLDLALNLGTARTMGLAFPPTLLSRADQLVE
ncbi:MAG: ABC transporter substrate-binding protein [Reyranella sp.]|nr:ABC transporter substrate-binding protein [Reyranella sp.]